MMLHRLGLHELHVLNARANFMPSRANRSRFRVRTLLQPYGPESSAPRSSAIIRMRFGGWAARNAAGATPEEMTQAAMMSADAGFFMRPQEASHNRCGGYKHAGGSAEQASGGKTLFRPPALGSGGRTQALKELINAVTSPSCFTGEEPSRR